MKKVLGFSVVFICLASLAICLELNIIDGPESVITSFNDFFPSSTTSISFREQPNEIGGGQYAVFHAKENEYSNNQTYYVYIDNNGNVSNVSTICGYNYFEEGFPSVDIDPETGDPIAAWNREDGVVVSYDLYHLGSPGLWRNPFYVFNDAILSLSPLHPDDFFLYPIVEIGESPDLDKRRVYILARNQRIPNDEEEYVNAMLAYADYDVMDFNCQSDLDWSYNMCLITTNSNQDTYFTFTIGEGGNCVIMGYNNDHEVFAAINENYGEGDFIYSSELFEFPVDNPLNLDGTPRFIDDFGNPYDLFFAPLRSENINCTFIDNDTKVISPMNFALMAQPDIWFENECLLYPKVVEYEIDTNDFSFTDLYITGLSPIDNIPMIPWDLDEDGEVDNYDTEGEVVWENSWPMYYPVWDSLSSQNYFKISRDKNLGVTAIVWNDGTNAKLEFLGILGYEDWNEVSEIAITVGSDNSPYWSEPGFLNSNTNVELENMIPAYTIPNCNIIESGTDEFQVDLLFFDDYCFGPSTTGTQPIQGGEINYLRIEFEYSIPDPPLFWVQYPNGGEVWYLGQTYAIQWVSNGIYGPFTIQLLDNDQFVYEIANDIYPCGYVWTIPADITPSDSYKVRVFKSDMSISDTSDDDFSIHYYFEVISPMAGEEILAGNVCFIDWNVFGLEGPFSVELYEDEQFVMNIVDGVFEAEYVWTIPENIEPGNDYSIRVTDEIILEFSNSGFFTILEPLSTEIPLQPLAELFQNSPNPFNPSTTISFSLTEKDTQDANIEIFNSKGQKVKTLNISPLTDEQTNSVIWNGTDDSGKPVSSGVYLYKLKARDFEESKKMLLIK